MVIPPDRPDRLDAQKSLAALSACVANAVGFPLAIGPAGECKVSYPGKLCGRKGHQCPLWVKSRHGNAQADVRFVPIADIPNRLYFLTRRWMPSCAAE
jgi:hypothetical protein